nr:hypothetical protein [uncultured Flavobacterium sp.]
MENWKVDRIYVMLSSALNFNSDHKIKFFFDRKDNLFFQLYKEEDDFQVISRDNLLSQGEREILLKKIDRLKSEDFEIIEIRKLPKTFHIDRSKPAKNQQEYDEREKLYHSLGLSIKIFLDQNNIYINKCDLIEGN